MIHKISFSYVYQNHLAFRKLQVSATGSKMNSFPVHVEIKEYVPVPFYVSYLPSSYVVNI